MLVELFCLNGVPQHETVAYESCLVLKKKLLHPAPTHESRALGGDCDTLEPCHAALAHASGLYSAPASRGSHTPACYHHNNASIDVAKTIPSGSERASERAREGWGSTPPRTYLPNIL